jgi:hypothetical protein
MLAERALPRPEDRRRMPRTTLRPGVYCNTFVDGHPFLGQILDLSTTGIRLRRVGTPVENSRAWTPLELGIPGESRRIFLCGERVRDDGEDTSYVFVGMEPSDQSFLRELVENGRPDDYDQES